MIIREEAIELLQLLILELSISHFYSLLRYHLYE